MHIAIVGGGLGGLATAALLAPHATVTLYERAGHLGGRARSQVEAGATLNLGPHALYRASAAMRVLRRLGVTPRGAAPPFGGLGARGGALHELPGTALSLARTGALSFTEKLQLAPWLYARNVPDVPLADWLATAPPGIADLMRALVRVSSYTNAPALQSARVAMRQVTASLQGVVYLDGGWDQLVRALVRSAEGEAAYLKGTVDLPLPAHPTAAVDVRLGADVDRLPDADAVVLAGPPSLARRFGVAVPDLPPVRAACLDLVLDGLPRPDRRFVLGLDQPLYLSEHGAVAALGGTVLHVARYLAPTDAGADALPELESLLDQVQPGWRERVRFRRFLPELVVTHRIDRPGEQVEAAYVIDGRPVHLVGDWVGEDALLADRSFASAERAADALLARLRQAA